MSTAHTEHGEIFRGPPRVDGGEHRDWVADHSEEAMRQLRQPFRSEPADPEQPADEG